MINKIFNLFEVTVFGLPMILYANIADAFEEWCLEVGKVWRNERD